MHAIWAGLNHRWCTKFSHCTEGEIIHSYRRSPPSSQNKCGPRCGTHGGVHIRGGRTPTIEVNHFSFRRSHRYHEPKALKKIINKTSPLLNLPCMIKIILHLCTHISYLVGEFFGQRILICFSILDEVKIW